MPDNGNPEQNRRQEIIKPLWFLFTVGWYVVLSLVIPTAIGIWLDEPQQFNTKPLYTFIGLSAGTIIAFVGLAQMLRRFYKKQKESWGNEKKEPEK